MQKLVILALLALLFSCSNKKDSSTEGNSSKETEVNWELVWEDNFEVDGLPNPDIWSYEEGYIRNKEAQYYTRARMENARVENGNLLIEARKDNWEGNEITSASLHTYDKKSILYGKIEVRAKLPTGVGTWPAIWMLGDNKKEVGWPTCGEIDIMENVGFNPDVIHANIHTKAYNHAIGTGKGDKITIEKPYHDFHVYTVEWFEKEMHFSVDGKRYFSYQNDETGNDSWPFDKSHYLIINLAIGGGWGGKQGIAEDLLPQQYLIDYVKVYQQK